MRSIVFGIVAAIVAIASPTAADAPVDKLPTGYVVVSGSTSPDGKWQVIMPSLQSQEAKAPPCEARVVSVDTGALLTNLTGDCLFEHESGHMESARWSTDSHTLLWQADGKWGSNTLLLIQLEGDKVASVVDARAPGQTQILAAIRRMSAKKYATSKQRGKDNGSWFRDGFAVDVRPLNDEGVKFPISFHIDITSDWKCMWPARDLAGGTMTATIDAAHQWKFSPFVAGHKGCDSNGAQCQFSDCQ